MPDPDLDPRRESLWERLEILSREIEVARDNMNALIGQHAAIWKELKGMREPGDRCKPLRRLGPDLSDRVTAMEQKLSDGLAILDGLEHRFAAGPRRVPMQDVIRERLPVDLPDLCIQRPQGVTLEIIAEHFGFPLPTTIAAINDLAAQKKIQWIMRQGTKAKIALPMGVAPPDPALTESQRRVLAAATLEIAEHDGYASHRAVALRAGFRPSSVDYILSCLVKSGRLEITQHGGAGRPSRYQIPLRPDEPERIVAHDKGLPPPIVDMTKRAVSPPERARPPRSDPAPAASDFRHPSAPKFLGTPIPLSANRSPAELAALAPLPPNLSAARPVRDVTAVLMGDPPPGRTPWAASAS